MGGLFRRSSGVYFARLAVPARHRQAIGKREFVASTGTRVVALARIVGGEILARWRRLFLELDAASAPMDLLRVSRGSPLLSGDGLLPLADAEAASGIPADELLREVSAGKLRLFVNWAGGPGHVVYADDLEHSSGEIIVPTPREMDSWNERIAFPGVLMVRQGRAVASSLLVGSDFECVLFDMVARPGVHFAPERPFQLNRRGVLVDKREVEQLRLRLSARVTPEQLAAATAANTSADSSSTWTARKGRNLMSDAVDAFIADQSPSWARDHARRVRAACDLFVELSGDRPVVEVDRDHLRQYRDTLLPAVPARENKVRLRYGTSTVSESIQVVSGTEWPTLSQGERDKRMQWLALLFAWLHSERWVADNPAVGLARPRRKSGERKTRDQDKRDPFTDEDLQAIFSAPWFRTGRGELTKNGTYREFLPFYYWLPLLGLFTGARINELCQLAVTDLRRSGAGVWFIDINDEDEHKKVKTANAIRRVPVHPFLLECGLDRWHEALSRAGYRRLFPELKRDSIKGHSKGAVRWFSDYLGRQGIPRDNRKVFHSFRHGLTTLYTNELGVAGEVVNQLEGWSRGKGVRESTYRKDELPDRLIESVRRVKFNLPPIAPFDTEAGLKAVRDTLRRKNGGRGAAEDCSPPGPTS